MKKVLPIIILAVFLGVVVSLVTQGPGTKGPVHVAGQLKVHCVDVGQGDCILIQAPDGRNMLVDAGGEDSAESVVRYLVRNGVNRIDTLVITHPHMDHIGGLAKVLEQFGVARILDAGCPHGSQTYQNVLSAIESRKIDYQLATPTAELQVGKEVDVEILWPPTGYSPAGESGLNNGSVVMRVDYGDVSVLLAGDVQREAEGRLLASHRNLRATILKVAHHGSEDSTSNEFLQVVKPAYAVISVGAGNPYGQPARVTLRRLAAAGARVFRTDVHGSVVFTTDGRKVEVASER